MPDSSPTGAKAWLHVRRSFEHVLEKAGASSDTLIVITADHGEAFLENGMVEHGLRLADTLVRVPLIMAGPDL